MNGTNQSGGSAPGMILGTVASSGLARGRALLCDCARHGVVPRRRIDEAEAPAEFGRFTEAVSAVEQDLLRVQECVRRSLGQKEAEIFEAQILLLRDEQLRGAVREFCVEGRMNVEAALDDAIGRLVDLFGRIEDPYFRERAADLRDVGKRILDRLADDVQSGIPDEAEGCILVAGELMSSAVAQLEGRAVRGLIAEKGGLTAHATILARALGIPTLVGVAEATVRIRPGDLVIVDALAGRVFINPGPDVLGKYHRVEADLRAHQSSLKDLVDSPAITADGTAIRLSANVGQTADAVAAARVKADGAGLYRTEFIFMVQDHFPSEEEQYQFYRATAEHLRPARTVIRVLDIGSDKPLDYFPLAREANPALGRRGTRLLLAHPAVLRTQLRAILRLGASHPVAILLPMIGGIDELRAARAAIEDVRAELAAEGLAHDPEIEVGAMIETPAAAILAGQLADEVDFFSVGTNDLVQYLLAADRIGGESTPAYEPLHPAVIRTLSSLVTAARAKGRPISLCGEIASDPALTRLLLGLGFRHFSVSPGRLLEVKHAIRSTQLEEAEALAHAAMSMGSARGIRTIVEDDWSRRRPVTPPDIPAGEPDPPAVHSVTHDAGRHRFELRAAPGRPAFLSYTHEGDRVVFAHTEVPEELRGRGLAAVLVRAALEEARRRRWAIVPRCEYVARFMGRNPEFADLASPSGVAFGSGRPDG